MMKKLHRLTEDEPSPAGVVTVVREVADVEDDVDLMVSDAVAEVIEAKSDEDVAVLVDIMT